MPDPVLLTTVRARTPRGVVLLLHGGTEDSHLPASRWGAAALRMLPVALELGRRGRGRVEVVRLVHAVRGWNGPQQSPVADARWALAELRRRRPGVPVVLLGHSMGGRTALHVADDPAVVAVVGLAPWVTATEGPEPLRDRTLVVLHGSADRMTSPGASRGLVRAAQGAATRAVWLGLDGQGHTLLARGDAAGRLAARTALGLLPGARRPRPGSRLAALLTGDRTELQG